MIGIQSKLSYYYCCIYYFDYEDCVRSSYNIFYMDVYIDILDILLVINVFE